jgi:predicted Zn-dependent peptidase
VARPDDAQDTILVAWPIVPEEASDRPALEALLYLLGETGYAGRLGRALVEPGLVYSVEAVHDDHGPAGGVVRVVTAAARRDSPEVVRRIRAELERLVGGGLTAAELAEARTYLRGKAARARQGTRRAAQAALGASSPAPAAEVDGLTLAQIEGRARRLFAAGAPVAVVAGVPGYPSTSRATTEASSSTE